MTVNDFINLDSASIREMTREQINAAARKGAIYANKRLAALRAKGLDTISPAYESLSPKIRDYREYVPSASRLRAIADIRELQRFLQAKTSTVKGARAYQRKMAKILPAVGVNDWPRFWAAVDMARDAQHFLYSQISSGQVIKEMQGIWESVRGEGDVVGIMEQVIQNEYTKFVGRLEDLRIDPFAFRR